MAFHYDTICHFRCNNQLSSPAGRVSLLFGLNFGTRGMWAVMQMAGEEEIFRCTIDCPCRGHLLKHGFVPSCTANSCDEKTLNGSIKKAQFCFFMSLCISCWPRALNTGFDMTIIYKRHMLSQSLRLFRLTCFTFCAVNKYRKLSLKGTLCNFYKII